MSESYIGALSRFAFKPAVVVADGAAVVLAALVPLAYTVSGNTMPDGAFQIVGTLVGVLIVAVVLMRAMTAPYFVWKEQRAKINELQVEIAKPDQLIRARLDQRIAESRIELTGYVVRLQGIAPRQRGQLADYMEGFTHPNVQELVSHLSYDAQFNALWAEFTDTMFKIVQHAPNASPAIPPPPNANPIAANLQYWDEAGTRAKDIQGRLVRHLMMKSSTRNQS